MRHTWHADQETTVLLHFCHHLPTDFFHIPIWMGGLDFLSISSPLTASQQKAPLVRFLSQQLITQSGVFWLWLQRPREVTGIRSVSASNVFIVSTVFPGWVVNCQNSSDRRWRTRCRVSSTNYQLQLPSVTFINMCFIWGRPFWRLGHFMQSADERLSCFLC